MTNGPRDMKMSLIETKDFDSMILYFSVSVPAPAPVSSPSCWTEQSTVWETQYVDTVTQECSPVTKQECSPVTKVIRNIRNIQNV